MQYTRDARISPATRWRSYRLLNNQQESIVLDPPIIARHVRIHVEQQHENLCIQLQFLGCPFTDGVVSYSMLQGSHQLEDDTYDGEYDDKQRYLYGKHRTLCLSILHFHLQTVSVNSPMVKPVRTIVKTHVDSNG